MIQRHRVAGVSHGPVVRILAAALVIALGGCSSLGSSGPSTRDISSAGGRLVENSGIKVVDLTDAVTQSVRNEQRPNSFFESLGDAPATATIIRPGDAIDVTVWEAPPAMLFGNTASLSGAGASTVASSSGSASQQTTMPEMMVDGAGRVQIPFAGAVPVAGLTPTQVEREIKRRLTGKAHQPEIIVRLVRNATAAVTVVGEVGSNIRVPLTPRGERLLDVLASAGGVKQETGKMTLQITRGGRVLSMPMDSVIRDPAQNIRLQADDVVAALYQPYSFTALGAAGTSSEIPFEGTGLTLAQALGRVGGLKDDRADGRGVFIFRLEDPAALDPAYVATARRTPEGRIPVIYRANLKDPATLFVAQRFPIRDEDVIYVSNARLTDLQRFVQLISSLVFPVIGLSQAIP